MSSHNDKLSRLFSLSESDRRLTDFRFTILDFGLIALTRGCALQILEVGLSICSHYKRQGLHQKPIIPISLSQRRVHEVSPKALAPSKILLPICVLLVGGGLVGCSNIAQIGNSGITLGDRAGNVTKIGDLKPNPNAATQVYLQGKVIDQAPFLKAGAYQLQDTTGKIWIVTNQTLPNVGDTLVIKGKLQFKSIPLGGQELGEVYVEEQKKL